jgi:uncharacterized membrane protein YidH (DUF202 family)
MPSAAQTPVKADLRDYLAAERTVLAWIRTGLALMGLGFVVALIAAGKTRISYNSPTYLKQRHGIPEDVMARIAVVEALAAQAGA